MLLIGRRWYFLAIALRSPSRRTHALIKYIRENGVPGLDVDFVLVPYAYRSDTRLTISYLRYVDEVQDNLLIDALSKLTTTSPTD